MEDTWSTRDLPVLKAIVEIYDSTGRTNIRPTDITSPTGFDEETVQRAVRALYTEPYLIDGMESSQPGYVFVGIPTTGALRVVGAWPTPESQLDRLIAALTSAAEDEERPEDERSKFKQAALWLGSFASQVAIGALGGAGGNILS